MRTDILYIHGMGGGADSRIPNILKSEMPDLSITVRTYDFDPEIANSQISSWIEELDPRLVIGESMGSIHAMAVKGRPHLFVSPAIGGPGAFRFMGILAIIPGVTALFDHIYKPRPGERQALHFVPSKLFKWRKYWRLALENRDSGDLFFAFFGHHDHYRKWGVVNVRKWKRLYGADSYAMYDGTHFMEEEYLRSLLIPKIREVL